MAAHKPLSCQNHQARARASNHFDLRRSLTLALNKQNPVPSPAFPRLFSFPLSPSLHSYYIFTSLLCFAYIPFYIIPYIKQTCQTRLSSLVVVVSSILTSPSAIVVEETVKDNRADTINAVSGLSAAHTIYLAGGNVLVLDKQGMSYLVHCALNALSRHRDIDHSIQVSSEETPQKPHPVSTLPLQERRSTKRLPTVLSSSTMIPSSLPVTRRDQTSSRSSHTSLQLPLSGSRMSSTWI